MNQEGKDLALKDRKKYFISCFVSPIIGLTGLSYVLLRTYEMDNWIKVIAIMLAASFTFLGFYAPIRGYIIANRVVLSIKKEGSKCYYNLASGKTLLIDNEKVKFEKNTLSLFHRTSAITIVKTLRYNSLIILDDFWEDRTLLSKTDK